MSMFQDVRRPVLGQPSRQLVSQPADRQSLVLIDAAVEAAELLSQHLIPGTEVIWLKPGQDGIRQITAALAGRSNLDALHLVSHGRSAQIQLGTTWLSAENLNLYGAQLQQWRRAFRGTARLLIYGCEVAANDLGKAFIQQISEWLGIPVAASQGIVGNAAVGGTWNLEVTTAPMSVDLAFQPMALQAYPHRLGGPNIRIFDASLDEGNSGTSSLSFTLVLDAANPVATTVDYEIRPDSATAGSDYSDALTQGTITFAPNQTSQTITIEVLGDLFNEASELFFVKLSNPTGGAVIADDTAIGIILNDDPRPTLAIDDVTLSEADIAAQTATFTVTLSAASNQFVSVNYRTVDGTATAADSDFTNTSGRLIFEPGETSKTITVPVLGDFKNEADETFRVTLSGATNATIADGQGTGTISNNDAAPSVSVGNVSVTEGGDAVFTVSLSAVSGQEIKVDYATADATAKAGSDYSLAANSLTFAPGETSKTVTVSTTDDAAYESSENFTLNLSGAVNATIGNGAGGNGTGTATVTDNDPLPALSVADATVNEGNGGSQTLSFTLTLTAASSQPVTVDYTTVDGTAVAGSDYSLSSGSVTFAPGQTSQVITVAVAGDQTFESDESFTVVLSSPTGVTLADNSATGTISNDDPQPTISIGDGSSLEGNGSSGTVSFTIALSNPSSETITVGYQTAAGTADANDYTTTTGSITFRPGETSQTIQVQTNGDSIDEANESFQISLSSPTNATIGDGQGSGEIIDDDGIPTVSIADVAVEETDGGTTVSFVVTLSNPTSNAVTVDYATANGTASATDYTSATGTVTFAPGETTQTIAILIAGDAERELNETFLIDLTNPAGATLGDAQATGTILNDDPLPTITINDVELVEGDSGSVNAVFTVTMTGTSSEVVVVNYSTADDTAQSGTNDYTAASGSLTFNPGETSQTFTVAVQGDRNQEIDETFRVNLSSSNATVVDGQGIGTIKSDEAPPALSIANAQVAEGNTGTSMLTFTVSLSQASTETVTVRYTTLAGTAADAEGDFTDTNGTLTFNPGELSKTIAVELRGDVLSEADETFQVELLNPTQATLAQSQATGTILNDDPLPSLSIQDASFSEGNNGVTEAVFTVSLSTASAQSISLNYATADDTAKVSDNDYLPTSGLLNFAPGELRKTIAVGILGDRKLELDEMFRLNLTNLIGATIANSGANGGGAGRIINDDSVPSLSIDSISLPEGNAGQTTARFSVSLSAPSSQPVSVDYTTVDSSATLADGDYQAVAQSLSFAPGETSKTIEVLVNGDRTVEASETFSVLLRNPQNATITQELGNAVLENDDTQPLLSSQNASAKTVSVSGTQPEQVTGNAEADQIQGGNGNDRLDGAGGNDLINGGDGNDILYGREGSDQLFGGDGDDMLYGGKTRDEVEGGQGKDQLYGGRGDDLLVGSAGGDELYGREGNDKLLGRQGNDFLGGGTGRDQLTGGLGQDRLRGGKGKDQFQFLDLEEGGDSIADFTGQDLLVVSAKGFGAGLKIGKLQQSQFHLGQSAASKTDRFIYSAATGALYFDQDGSGDSPQTLLATFSNRPALRSENIRLIA